jgi:hypothetical protein
MGFGKAKRGLMALMALMAHLNSRKQWLGMAKRGLIALMALLALKFGKGD